jgi:hypothetical protein
MPTLYADLTEKRTPQVKVSCLDIFRLEQAPNDVSIAIPSIGIEKINNKRNMRATPQGPGLTSDPSWNPGVLPHVDVGAIPEAPNETLLEQGHSL